METPVQSPMEEVAPPPPVESLSPGDNAISPTREPINGNSPEIPDPPTQSSPPPLSSPPPEPSPSPPPIGAPPPTPSSPDPPTNLPPPSESSPPPSPQLDQPAISPPPPSSTPPETSPSPPTLNPPTNSPPPPPRDSERPPPPPPSPPPQAVSSPRPSPSPPASGRPSHSPPSKPPLPPPRDSEPPPPPPPQDSKRPVLPPPPPPPQDSKHPVLPPPPPPRDSERPVHSSHPPPEEILQPPKSSPLPLPSNSSSSPTLPSPPSPPTRSSLPGSDNSSISTAALVGVSIGVALLLLSLIGVVVWCLMRRKKRLSAVGGGFVMPSPMTSSPRSDSALLKTQSSAPLVGIRSSNQTFFSQSEPGGFGQSKELFSYEELVNATNGFSDENLLGEGGFGCVYKGVLPDGRVVAVKQLKVGGGQGDREFKAEVETISRVHHRNLLSLVGYCISENRRLLIYDYVPNNNLYFHLHGAGTPGLDWATRVKIAAGAARGLAYLHEDCHPRIIHRDIKSSNILLENNFHPLVSDFGLAKLALDCNTHITTRVMGTFGYMAPEYASSGKLTEKSDVFSFGVVLLELITGRKPVDTSQPLGDESLVEWARPLLSHAIETEEFKALADPKLGGNYVDAEMFRMIEAAAACIRHAAAKRPRMSQIVRAFDSLAEEDLTNGMRLGESEIINSAEQSAEIRLFRRMAFGSQNYSTDFFTRNSDNSRDENV
ncbi:unnamed protein product [Arabis nemorensis]|uniref:non-specific serine/threonine protein kinase n=1 Tax=Arabis nemorensis TaxID=586526 RepID=A0A565CL15_9BRAS|nr:unnamed protein product [Arabis nemorensis]